jgi:hypothetical protein
LMKNIFLEQVDYSLLDTMIIPNRKSDRCIVVHRTESMLFFPFL